jgi:hypothetical protein
MIYASDLVKRRPQAFTVDRVRTMRKRLWIMLALLVTVLIVVGGVMYVSAKGSLLFYRDGVIVQAMVIANSEADFETADRFLSSVASRPK